LDERRSGIRLLAWTSLTPVWVSGIASRFQKENGPPANFGSSKMAEKPRALESVGFLSPDDQKPPSPEVAYYLRGRGLGTESSGRR